ncbi:nitroimidazol reductase NimA-like FMN-containing flavoprotein (pyridoxamine 5'-phosphate oxidase superfamily) [Catalinimonas alkaloidigena]|uniref:pyridoxamine 5'-phosphate oxidase family protein n=1 Tax=Catalinimonas alkaloidigena TaxID=1075417 RepID=UPI002404C17F|nr:pyridoxamine 5'-phosphate oxidase family protein [Catalinimonas alkaloidigena]MDF9796532.1 nitroimidazol reductase NimA-like FMN-containing flavoprotein (pyridoxamine 5'-phosphate oxidase superfamily) [Catalinimonas alkaloidigena]
MTGQLTDHQIDTLLTTNLSGKLGCCAADQPYVVPIAYAFYQGYIYSHTREGAKVDIMRRNPNICFEVDEIDNMANWRSVIVQGEFEELNGEEAEEGMLILKNRLSPYQISVYSLFLWDIQTKKLATKAQSSEVIFRIRIHEKSGRFEKSE